MDLEKISFERTLVAQRLVRPKLTKETQELKRSNMIATYWIEGSDYKIKIDEINNRTGLCIGRILIFKKFDQILKWAIENNVLIYDKNKKKICG
ncbi:MAG: hypothetical protein ABH808_02555 [Candidatus Kuenenbacteria bacterium]